MLGKFARVALRTANIDYNGRFCMASAAAAGLRAFGIDRGLPFPLQDIPGAEAILLVGGNPADTMPPLMQYFEEQRRRGGKLIVVDPRRSATAKLAIAAPADHARHRRGARQRAPECRDQPPADRRRLHRRAHLRLRPRSAASSRPTGRTVSSASPACRRARSKRPPTSWRQAATAMVLTGRGPEQQSHGVDNVLAFINLALALGKAGKPVLRLRLPDRAGQRAGRPRARAEGGPASRLSPARQSPASRRDCRDLGHRSPTTCRGPACPPPKCWPRSARRSAAFWCSPRMSRFPRRRRSNSAPGSMPSTCWWWPTSSCPRPLPRPTWCFRWRSGRKRKAP